MLVAFWVCDGKLANAVHDDKLTITLTLGFAERREVRMLEYESRMDWAFRLPMLTSLVPSINCTMSGLVFLTQPAMYCLATSYAW